MSPIEILFDAKGHAKSPSYISDKINKFGDSYNNAVEKTINDSKVLDKDGEVFIDCASHILKNFGMTRSGPFHGNNIDEILSSCWNAVGANLREINNSVRKSGLPRDRYILELRVRERERLIAEIWLITKKLLPLIMVKPSFGLV